MLNGSDMKELVLSNRCHILRIDTVRQKHGNYGNNSQLTTPGFLCKRMYRFIKQNIYIGCYDKFLYIWKLQILGQAEMDKGKGRQQ